MLWVIVVVLVGSLIIEAKWIKLDIAFSISNLNLPLIYLCPHTAHKHYVFIIQFFHYLVRKWKGKIKCSGNNRTQFLLSSSVLKKQIFFSPPQDYDPSTIAVLMFLYTHMPIKHPICVSLLYTSAKHWN